MAGLYLGTNTVANLYLGTTEVCSTYLGTNQPFDNCTYTPSTLTLLYQSSYVGDRAYLITDNPANGTVLSGQPGATGTFVISNPSYPDPGFEGSPNPGDFPTLSSTSNISATFPASGNLNVTGPTRSGGLNTIPATPNITASLSATAGGSNYSVAVSPTQISGQAPLSYSFTITVTPNTNYEITAVNPSTINGVQYTYSQSGNNWVTTVSGTTSSNLPLSTSVAATATLQTFNFSASVTNCITGSGSPTVTTTLTGQSSSVVTQTATHNFGSLSGTQGTTYTLTANTSAPTGYQFTQGPTYTPSSSINITSAGSYSINVTGTTSIISNDAQFIGYYGITPFSTKLATCNGTAGNATTVYFVGGSAGDPGYNTRVYVGSSFTSELSTGWYYNDDTSEPIYYTYGSGVSSIDSC